ncbi:MAG: sodium:proline symporter, partial [Treponemataceae bacterium]|nr:sodium:proline symporter [Treponemataceae bacterium]
GIINKNADEKTVLNFSRLTVFIIALVALLLSLDSESSIFKLVSYSWAGFGATFGPIVLLALYWRGMTSKGAIAGLIGGFLTVVIWHNLGLILGKEILDANPILKLYEIVPGFLVCLILSLVISILDKNKNAEMLENFDSYKAMPD